MQGSLTAAGPWDIYFDAISLNSADGTVRPIYNGQSSLSLDMSGTSGVSGRSYEINHLSGIAAMPDQTTSYYHTDQLSSARLMTSVNGYAIWAATYLPFGYEYNAQPGLNRYKFATYQRDAESGLDYAKFRYYSSTIGRFLSPDPAGIAAVDLMNPQSLNRYGYVGNDPLNATDAAGLNPRNLDSGSLDLHFGSGSWFGNCTENGAQSQCGGMFGLLGFDALQACPGNDCSPKNYNGQWYFFEAHADGSFGYFAFGQSSEVTNAANDANAGTSACIGKGVQSAFSGVSVTMGGSTGEVGGHWNFSLQLHFSSQGAASAFRSTYITASSGWPPPARFGPGPALHLENLGGSWSASGGTYTIAATAHIDLFNPDTGAGGIAGHVLVDGAWGHIKQLFGGNIDPKRCPF